MLLNGLTGADLGIDAADVAALVAELPTGVQVLTSSAGSVAAMEYDLAHTDRTDVSALLRGRVVTVEGRHAVLATDQAERCTMVTHGRLLPGDEGWAAVVAERNHAGEPELVLAGWSPGTRPVTMPLYDTSLARCLLRSSVMAEAVAAVPLPGLDEATTLVRHLLLELHRLSSPQHVLGPDVGDAGEVAQFARQALLATDPASAAAHWADVVARVTREPDPPAEAAPAALLATEQRAVEHLRRLGVHDAVARRTGADGVVEVVASDVAALVEPDAVVVHERALQAVVGIASLEKKVPVFFSAGGFSLQALEWADRADLACFGLAEDGSVEPRSIAALDLMRTQPPAETAQSTASLVESGELPAPGTGRHSLPV